MYTETESNIRAPCERRIGGLSDVVVTWLYVAQQVLKVITSQLYSDAQRLHTKYYPAKTN